MMMCIIYLYKREKKGRNFCNELLFVVLIRIHDNKTRLRSLFLSLSLRAEDDAH